MPEMVRVQIDLPRSRVEVLDGWADEAGGMTRKDVFSNALALLNWAVTQVKNGREIVSVDAHEKRMMELHMPFLDALKPK